MGHITTDLIKDAWRELKVADNLIDAGQTYAGVMKCENALRDLSRSSETVSEGVWFTGQENSLRKDIGQLKRTPEPSAEDVRDLVTETRRLVKKTRERVVPIINDRLDYETSARLS